MFIVTQKYNDEVFYKSEEGSYINENRVLLGDTIFETSSCNIYEGEDGEGKYYYEGKYSDVSKEEKEKNNKELMKEIESTNNQLINFIEDIIEFCETKGFVVPDSKKDLISSRKELRQRIK